MANCETCGAPGACMHTCPARARCARMWDRLEAADQQGEAIERALDAAGVEQWDGHLRAVERLIAERDRLRTLLDVERYDAPMVAALECEKLRAENDVLRRRLWAAAVATVKLRKRVNACDCYSHSGLVHGQNESLDKLEAALCGEGEGGGGDG